MLVMRKILMTAFGKFIAFASERGMCALEPPIPLRQTLILKRLQKWHSSFRLYEGENTHICTVQEWLVKFFQGDFDQLPLLSLDLRGSPFELAVWDELRRIPAGETVTYDELACRLARPTAARAVGGAVGRNPIALIVPCHRVIGKNGKLTGYGGGIERKRYLLAHEGSVAKFVKPRDNLSLLGIEIPDD